MRYVVLGANGQLGRDLCPILPGEVIPTDRARANLDQPETLRKLLEETRPQVVVNCAAYNLVDKAESEPLVAFATNALGARELALLCHQYSCLLVHYSTDYVFGLDAVRLVPWGEQDAPGPISVYGNSKLAGEYFVRSLCPRHLVIRTCGLYGVWGSGGKGTNFVETMLRLAGQGKPLRVVQDQVLTPSFTRDVARTTLDLIDSGQTGLFHVTNSGACSWFEFARTIFELSGLQPSLSPITSEEFGAKARRPPYSVLSCENLMAKGIPTPRPWQEALLAYLSERLTRSQE